MHKLISEKCTVACSLSNFDYAHYPEHYFLIMFITPKHLKLFAGGGLLGDFVNNPLEGYRTLGAIKITQTNPILPNTRAKAGVDRKAEL